MSVSGGRALTVKKEAENTAQPLSARERNVIKAVFEGLTNKEIAANMQISESSVKAVLQQLFERRACVREASWSGLQSSSTPATGWMSLRFAPRY